MKIKKELNELIEVMLKDGVRVFAQDWEREHSPVTYLHFTKGNMIGYVQLGYFGTYEYSTVHKPSKGNGTGFSLKRDNIAPLDYSKAFYPPNWAMRYAVTKYRDWEEFVKSRAYPNFVEITEVPTNNE